MKKRIIIFALLLSVLLTAFCSCEKPDVTPETASESTEDTSAETAVKKDPPESVIFGGEWYLHDGKLDEKLYMSISDNGTFSCRCECGSHESVLSAYTKAVIDTESRAVTLTGSAGEEYVADILYFDRHLLWLKLEDGARLFKNAQNEIEEVPHRSAEKYFTEGEYTMFSFRSYEDGLLTLASFNYDRDSHEYFENFICKVPTADNITFTTVTVTVDHTSGGVPVVEYAELTPDDLQYIGEYYTGGYALLSEDGLITKVIFYGEIEIQ